MVEFARDGNLLEADVDALVNTVNTHGVMGKGIALQFKRAFPLNYKRYRAACEAGAVRLGEMFVTETGRLDNPRLIVNFPTKKHWKSRSRLADIETGLEDLRRVLIEHDVKSVAVPPLGCGLGGLQWSDVRPRIEAALGDLPLQVIVFEPTGAPTPTRMVDRRKRPKMTAGRAAFIGLLSRYLMPGDSASPLVVQKLLYFLQEAGQPLRLTFVKQRYGPYADQVRHAVIGMEGHFVTGFGDGTGGSDIQLLPEAVPEAAPFLDRHPATLRRFDRVAELIRGFETPYGLELLSTTHWVATREGADDDPERAVELVRAWSARKGHLFTPDHIMAAWHQLTEKGWLPEPTPDSSGETPDRVS
jgi:O-acetyl-ADP-ribose deacetylase (regulator of RNase III)